MENDIAAEKIFISIMVEADAAELILVSTMIEADTEEPILVNTMIEADTEKIERKLKETCRVFERYLLYPIWTGGVFLWRKNRNIVQQV